MRKIVTWVFIIAAIVSVISWGIIGLKLLDNNYNFKIEAYLVLISLVIFFVCAVFRVYSNKCPHCGKLQPTNGKYCSYCGKEINKDTNL